MINQFSKFLNRLFSSKSKPSFTPSGHSSISYKEYSVRADPELQGNQWITAGIISKELNGSIKESLNLGKKLGNQLIKLGALKILGYD